MLSSHQGIHAVNDQKRCGSRQGIAVVTLEVKGWLFGAGTK
jgi:hypothetical protein